MVPDTRRQATPATPVLPARPVGLQAPTSSRGCGVFTARPLNPQGPWDTQGSGSRLLPEPSGASAGERTEQGSPSRADPGFLTHMHGLGHSGAFGACAWCGQGARRLRPGAPGAEPVPTG